MAVCFLAILDLESQEARVRQEIELPNLPGFVTLKCDFHMHSVFSDGDVWPTVRVEEAWREGLDAIAITEHIEYQPHDEDIKTNHNRPYELALPKAESLGIILIKGGEITREMPPGHFNALFLEDCAALDEKDFRKAVKAAVDQGAFIFWNHPGWTGQQKDGVARWYDIQTELLKQGRLHGIEIANWHEYYPTVHAWALDKNLTMLGNSDIHEALYFEYPIQSGGHRHMTLVFAREKSPGAIKEALFAGRTAAFFDNTLAGKEQYLAPLFSSSVKPVNTSIALVGKNRSYLQLKNSSSIPYVLEKRGAIENIDMPAQIHLPPQRTALVALKAKSGDLKGSRTISLPYRVSNVLIAPKTGLPVNFEIQVSFRPEKD